MVNGKRKLLSVLILFVLLISAVMSVCVAYGRYYTDVKSNIDFITYDLNNIGIHGITPAAKRDAGEWNPVPTDWQENGTSSFLTFSISNGENATSFYPKNTGVKLRITATEGFDYQNSAVQLVAAAKDYGGELPPSGTVYTGIPQTITEQSPLYTDVGKGCIYRFFGEDGNEMVFALDGGKLDIQNLALSVTADSAELSLLRISLVPVLD